LISYTPIIQNLLNEPSSYTLDILRLDLIDKEISGNKWFKLKYNLEKARIENHKTIITFGGAFSNHIAATAAACNLYNLNCIGVIAGEEKEHLNYTLARAKKNGMHLHFVSREVYSKKNEAQFQKYLQATFGAHYIIPEGGSNEDGVLGCTEILRTDWNYDYIFCACGTATTYAGLLAKNNQQSKVIGISVLKGKNELPVETTTLLKSVFPDKEIKVAGNDALQKKIVEDNCIIDSYAFKGYAKLDNEVLNFKKQFETTFHVPLDHIYTAKLMYGVFNLIKTGKLKANSKLLAIHSGGLQGNKAFEERYHLMPNL
jgi:1-aminocyclopropane-1-carboxylate deaminase